MYTMTFFKLNNKIRIKNNKDTIKPLFGNYKSNNTILFRLLNFPTSVGLLFTIFCTKTGGKSTEREKF